MRKGNPRLTAGAGKKIHFFIFCLQLSDVLPIITHMMFIKQDNTVGNVSCLRRSVSKASIFRACLLSNIIIPSLLSLPLLLRLALLG